MKVLKTSNFIAERMKIRPVTNAEFSQIQQDIHKNPFDLTKEDLTGEMSEVPIGIAVRMLEEQKMQGNIVDISVFCHLRCADKKGGGFNWFETEQDLNFWTSVLDQNDFAEFFNKYPEYERYNLD